MKRIHLAALLLIALGLLVSSPAPGQPSGDGESLRKDIEALKEGQRLIQRELQEIRRLLTGRVSPPDPRGQMISVSGPSRGGNASPLTMVEFSDFECPFCARFYRETLPQLERDYIRTGKVKFVYRDFPIVSIHKRAFRAAETAVCAGAQGKYWEMHDRLFDNQKAMGPEDLKGHAKALGLEMAAFERCLDGGEAAAGIRKDIADAQRLGVQGTPTFFVGRTDKGKPEIKVLRAIRGAQPYANFKAVLDELLVSKGD
jgi:protein-disulfide isomerase